MINFAINLYRLVLVLRELQATNRRQHEQFIAAADNHDHATLAGGVYYRGYQRAIDDIRRALPLTLDGAR